MTLVDYTYFKGIIALDFSREDTQNKIIEYSDYYEELYMKLLMGNIEYYKYVTDRISSTHEAKYNNLLKASQFSYNNITYYLDIKTMLSYFIYYHLVSDKSTYDSPVGEMGSIVDNTIKVSPVNKLIRAFNKGVDMYNDAYYYLLKNSADFPDISFTNMEHINQFGI